MLNHQPGRTVAKRLRTSCGELIADGGRLAAAGRRLAGRCAGPGRRAVVNPVATDVPVEAAEAAGSGKGLKYLLDRLRLRGGGCRGRASCGRASRGRLGEQRLKGQS